MKYEDFLDNVLADPDVVDAFDEGSISALDEALYTFQNKSSTQKELDFYTLLDYTEQNSQSRQKTAVFLGGTAE